MERGGHKIFTRTEFIVGGRVGVTAVTSTWASGDIGPLGICTAQNALKQSFIQDINSAYHGQVFVFESGTESHYMTAATTLTYMNELIAPVSSSDRFN